MKEVFDYNKITLGDMVQYIEEKHPEDKNWFKKSAFVTKESKEGKKTQVYNHLKAKRAFCQKYMPEIIPVAKPKEPKKSDLLANW